MITNWNASKKTKVPACCSFDCCGNMFGRISKRYRHRNHTLNRIVRARRYAKRAERNQVRRAILKELFD